MSGRDDDGLGPSARRILLVDCDQFFVQCARIADPEGAGSHELLLVGGTASGRGVVTSASYATREYGVRSGMPTAHALRLCPAAHVVPVPRNVCARKSGDVRKVLERFSPVVAPASIDEAYIDMTGTEALYRGESLHDTATRMQTAVRADAGIHVSIGGGTSRIVAKLAAGRAKPAGVRIVPPGAELDFMLRFDLADIPGVGPVFARELESFGLISVEHVLRYERIALEQWLGRSRGDWLYRRARGLDGGQVEPDREARSMSREETFANDIADDTVLERELLELCVRLAADIRKDGLRARTITVKIRDGDFRTRSAARTIRDGVETDRAIFDVATGLLRKLRGARRVPARLLGVAATNFRHGQETQLAIFDEAAVESERDRRLTRAADAVRERFGWRAVRPGRLVDRPETRYPTD
ncbi:MAG TPA: DNA polymerase IV [Longimicrobiales bacterium]|nr:DNA polymerase IV [Longimicrobiales bacterium]